MAILENPIKKSILLTLLMILTPFAAATSITTFSDGSDTVVFEFNEAIQDGLSESLSIEIPEGETVTSASLNISDEPHVMGSSVRFGIESGASIWDPVQNNGLTNFSAISEFTYEDSGNPVPLKLKNESMMSDFESLSLIMDNTSLKQQSVGMNDDYESVVWQKSHLNDENTGLAGPDYCASGDVCWGTNFYDNDYLDDFTGFGDKSTTYRMVTDGIYLDLNLQNTNTYLYFSSWHSMSVSNLQSGGVHYNDCAYLEIRESQTGLFDEQDEFIHLPFNLQQSTPFIEGNGVYQTRSTTQQDTISRCQAPSNQYALAGDSSTPQNFDGWTTMAANLAPYLGSYVQIQFVMDHTEVSGSYQNTDRSGWYIDDLRIGSELPTESFVSINDISPPSNDADKQPTGYGLLHLDAFMPFDSQISVSIIDQSTNRPITTNGFSYENLQQNPIELWDINPIEYPFISISMKFISGSNGISSPELFGYNLGSTIGHTFTDIENYRGLQIEDNFSLIIPDFQFEPLEFYINSSNGYKFEKPIYGLEVRGIAAKCNSDLELTSMFEDNPMTIDDSIVNYFDVPIYDYSIKIAASECDIDDIWLDLHFGHHAKNLSLNFGEDDTLEWGYNQPAFGHFGRQTQFWDNEVSGISTSSGSKVLEIDSSTNSLTATAFFLLPRFSVISYCNVEFNSPTISSGSNPGQGFGVGLNFTTSQSYLGFTQAFVESELSQFNNLGQRLNQANQILSNASTPVFKTDNYGTEWVRIGFQISQFSPAGNGGTVTLESLEVIYNINLTISDKIGLSDILNQQSAIKRTSSTQNSPTVVDVNVLSSSGGGALLSNLSIETSQGYSSTIDWDSSKTGLYPNGQVYDFSTTHDVGSITNSNIVAAGLIFKLDNLEFSIFFNITTNKWEYENMAESYIDLLSSTQVNPLQGSNSGGVEIIWKFKITQYIPESSTAVILSSTLSSKGVIAYLEGILLDPSTNQNAVEKDLQINSFSIFNSIGVQQQLDNVNSNGAFRITSNVTLEEIDYAPNPQYYFLIVEERTLTLDGDDITVGWQEISNNTGFIDGQIDIEIDTGELLSINKSFRYSVQGYDGGKIICPNVQGADNDDCNVYFNVSFDILAPNLLSFELYDGSGNTAVDSNWNTLLDDSWAVPKELQQFRIRANDLPMPPESLVAHVWIEVDHDSNTNGQAEESEYISIPVQSDGGSPEAKYFGNYDDSRNAGSKGKVSIYVEGYDLSGNSIDGGSHGLSNDLRTYIAMASDDPSIKSLKITRDDGQEFIDEKSAIDPDYVGDWNKTIFAGNVYNVILELEDGNGWRDIDYVSFELARSGTPLDSSVIYYPGNNTIQSTSELFSIITDSQGNPDIKLRDMQGNALIDPFETDFYVQIPISFAWGLALNSNQEYEPSFEIKDRTSNIPILSSRSYRQSWYYADVMRLNYEADDESNQVITPILEDITSPIASNLNLAVDSNLKGSVSGGDTVVFSGEYSFESGLYQQVVIYPQIPLTLELTRAEAFKDTTLDYDEVEEEVTTHTFSNGKFQIPIKLPSYQNEFSFTFRLINLPANAQDKTDFHCSSISYNGCGQFTIKVDDNAPELVYNSWLVEKGQLDENDALREISGEMPTSTYHCVDVSFELEERNIGAIEDNLRLKWKYYLGDPIKGNTWEPYQGNYGTEPLSSELELSPGSGLSRWQLSGDCIDLWPITQPTQFEVEEKDLEDLPDDVNVNLVMWVEGSDGAGALIVGSGQYYENGSATAINPSKPASSTSSIYQLSFESAKFDVRNMRITPESPEIGDSLKLELELINIGLVSGSADLEIRSVTNNRQPVFEGYIVSTEIGIMQSQWVSIDLEEFTDATTGMYYVVYDNETGEVIYEGDKNGKIFNVKVSSQADDGFSAALIGIILVGIIVVLAVVVIVIIRRDRNIDFDDLYEEDDYEEKSYASVPSSEPYSAPPAPSVSPEMAIALDKFDFWTQEEIQGYFDQGWSIQQLEEWLENNE